MADAVEDTVEDTVADGRSADAGVRATSREQPAVASPTHRQAASTHGTAPARRLLLRAVVT